VKRVERDRLPAGAWDDACARSDEAWLFHREAWVRIETVHGAVEDRSFAMVDAGGAVAAVQPLYVQRLPLGPFVETLVHSGLHRHTGLAAVNGLGTEELAALRSLAMARIFEIADEVDADRIQLNAHNLAPARRSATRDEVPFWVSEFGFELGLQIGPSGIAPAPGMSTLCADQIVSLEAEPDVLFDRMEPACRRAVRKARKEGVSARWVEPLAELPVYWELARTSAARTGEALAPRAYHEDVARLGFEGGGARMLLAEREGRAAAALLLLVDKSGMHFLAGVSDPAALPYRVNDLVHWAAIELGRQSGLCAYRLGPIFPELPRDWPVSTVSRFKRKLGGRSVPVVQGSWFRRPQRYRVIAEDQIRLRTEERPRRCEAVS
jgi:hypothetical protein